MNERERGLSFIAFETERLGIVELSQRLDMLHDWKPAKPLQRILDGYETRLNAARARFDSKPVIAVAGPTGSGKSTLINALVGTEVVETGTRRPTTRSVTVITRDVPDSLIFREQLSVTPSIVTAPKTRLPDALLVDTPDTDSSERTAHFALVEEVLFLSDALVCVFDVTNPKRKDNIDALKSYVDLFNGENVFLVLNRCDRVTEKELNTEVIPDFSNYISKAWVRKPDAVFAVSARSSIQNPDWPEEAEPLHDRNELKDLRNALAVLSGDNSFADNRVRQACHLRETAEMLVKDAARKTVSNLKDVETRVSALNKSLNLEFINSTSALFDDVTSDITAVFCGIMATRWWGPAALYIGLWRRLINFKSPLSVFRFLNPAYLTAGTGKKAAGLKQDDDGTSNPIFEDMDVVDDTEVQRAFFEQWPSIADDLVKAGFSNSVRDTVLDEDLSVMLKSSQKTWHRALSETVQREAEKLSRPLFIFLINLPVVAIVLWIVVLASSNWYLATVKLDPGKYLSKEFFRHAFLMMFLWWLIPSWLMQIRVNRSVRKIPAKAIAGMKSDFSGCHVGTSLTEQLSVLKQIADE